MADRLAHRDLRNRSSEILREVAAGASYEITNHGEVVALLSPVAGSSVVRIRRATVQLPFASIARAHRTEKSQDVLDDLRGDR